jgi:hypothetical protein
MTVLSRAEMTDIGEHQRRREASRRRRSFSGPWSGGGVQEAEEQRKKNTVWGKKGQVNPRPHIYTMGPGSWGSW